MVCELIIAYLLICVYSGVFVYAAEPRIFEEIFKDEDYGYDEECLAFLRTTRPEE